MKEQTYEGYEIIIQQDQEAESPREWQSGSTMVCFHGRYRLGDEHDFTIEQAVKLEDSEEVVSLPIYLMDHSGLSVKTTPFGCPWDSSKIGFIFITKEQAKKEFGWQRITAPRLEEVINRLKNEVEIFDQYLRGDVFGYTIKDKENNYADSLFGIYGEEQAEKQAKEFVDNILEQAKKEAPAYFVGA